MNLRALTIILSFIVAFWGIPGMVANLGAPAYSAPNPAKANNSHLRLALRHWQQEDFRKAKHFIEKAIDHHPKDPRGHLFRAHFLLVQGRYSESADAVLEGLRLDSQWHTREIELALFFPDPQRFFKERTLLDQYVKSNPDQVRARFLLSYLYFFSPYSQKVVSLINQQSFPKDLQPFAKRMLRKAASSANRTKHLTKTVYAPRLKMNMPRTLRASHTEKLRKWYPYIQSRAIQYGIDPRLVCAVILVESDFNQNAVSHAGAEGLMQLIPATAERFGVQDSFNPHQNIEGGIRYLKFLFDTFGSLPLALAGYNAGERNVMKHGGIPPFNETQNYVRKVIGTYQDLSIP